MRYEPVLSNRESLPMQAVFEDTAPANRAPWVLPGTYLVRLTVNGAKYEQPIVVKMDPRVKTPAAALAEQFSLSKRVYDAIKLSAQTSQEVKDARTKAAGQPEVIEKLDNFEGHAAGRFGGGGRFSMEGPPTLSRVTGALEGLLGALQDADVAPTAPQKLAADEQLREMENLMGQWKKLKPSL
jgi:hypothetical protein